MLSWDDFNDDAGKKGTRIALNPTTPVISPDGLVDRTQAPEARESVIHVTAEDVRLTAEDVRVTAEDVRLTAEDVRVTAEDVRLTAEDGRVTAEMFALRRRMVA